MIGEPGDPLFDDASCIALIVPTVRTLLLRANEHGEGILNLFTCHYSLLVAS